MEVERLLLEDDRNAACERARAGGVLYRVGASSSARRGRAEPRRAAGGQGRACTRAGRTARCVGTNEVQSRQVKERGRVRGSEQQQAARLRGCR
jgi:hypothetical protein